MEIVVGLVVAACAVGIVVAAKAGAERARREREERWARVPVAIGGQAMTPTPAAGGAPLQATAHRRPLDAASRPPAAARTPATVRPPAAPVPGSTPAAAAPSGAARLTGAAPTRHRLLRPREPVPTPVARRAPRPPADPVDLNSASVEQLRTLPGVGVRAAERIAAHRERHGPFPSLAALGDVEGFDEHRVSRLAERATVGSSP
jgi:competence protein ComEA